MSLSRRSMIKLGVGASALPLLSRTPLLAGPGSGLEPGSTLAGGAAGTIRARPLPLSAVRLRPGPLRHTQELDAVYLLELEPDRMLAYYRERAGLRRRAEPYGGWDGGGRNLTGHIAGHYLSAVSLMYAATGDERFRQRADYLVTELKAVQDAHGDGYLSALEGGRAAFGRLARGGIESSSFDLNGEWSPWYTLHKTFAGLRDAYRHADIRVALEVEAAFAGWAEGVLYGLDEAQLEHMMNTEFGGMNEVLVDLYADTGDARWLELSYRFEHDDFTRPLKRHQDNLPGKHGNTQVPKLIGSAARFALTGDPGDFAAATFFWDAVVQHHSFATGGHGRDEYFGPPDTWGQRVDGRTAETCNVYNMLKLTRQLFALRPDPHYADFHERALFNHILGSMDPQDGRVTYMNPVGRGVMREYQRKVGSFTCCVGTGMESHALHGLGIFYEDGERLYVNLYSPSTAQWTEGGVRLDLETDFPLGEAATLRLGLRAPRELTLALRRPYWAGDGFAVKVNGSVVATADAAQASWRDRGSQYPVSADAGSSYVEVTRTWRDGDAVEVALPKTLRIEPSPDMPRRVALMWGPLVLAGDLGPEARRRGDAEDEGGPGGSADPPVVPVLVAAERPIDEWVKPVGDSPGHFRTDDVGRVPDADGALHDVDLVPYYQLHRRTFAAYWDTFTEDEWAVQRALYAAEAERRRRLEAATVAYLEPGEAVFEREYGFQGADDSRPYRIEGRPGRWAASWFSYRVPVEPEHAMALILTFHSDDRRYSPADFEVRVDGDVIAEHQLGRTDPPRFFDVRFPVPGALVQGKDTVTLRFQAKPGSRVPAIFGIRLVRADQLE